MQPSFKFLSIPLNWAIWTPTFLLNVEALIKLPLLTGPSQFRCHLWTCPTHQSDSKICFLGTQGILYGPSCYSQTFKERSPPTLNFWGQEHGIYKCMDWNDSFYINNVVISKYRIWKLKGIWETNDSNPPLFSEILNDLLPIREPRTRIQILKLLFQCSLRQHTMLPCLCKLTGLHEGILEIQFNFPLHFHPWSVLQAFGGDEGPCSQLHGSEQSQDENSDLSGEVVLFSLCHNDSTF